MSEPTIKEKREALEHYCDSHYEIDCTGCIFNNGDDWCDLYTEWTAGPDVIEEAYKKLFPPEPTEEVDEVEEVPSTHDIVNHPEHYCREGAMECIDEMITLFGREVVKHFCLCNAWKYRYRSNQKNGDEDIKKSDWYIRKFKELCECYG